MQKRCAGHRAERVGVHRFRGECLQTATDASIILHPLLSSLGSTPYLTTLGIRWSLLALEHNRTHHMKTKQPGRLVGSRKSVFANITDKTHARLQRRAEASHLSAAKYTGVALEFFMDLEDNFGGPLTDQFRAMILRQVGGMAAKLEKALQ